MKKKYYLTATMFLLMALVMAAQPLRNMIGNNPQSKQETIVQIGKNVYRNNQLITPTQQSKNVLSEPTDSATVHIQFIKKSKQDPNSFLLSFYNKDFKKEWSINAEDKDVRIPAGIYDIHSVALSLNGQLTDLLRHIKELVPIISDTTIVIDFSECVNEWTDEIQMANGELMTRKIIRQIDHEPWEETVVDGNILWEYGDLKIINPDFDFINQCFTSHPALTSNDDGSISPSGGYFNNISDRYTFIQNMCYACNDGNFYTSYATGNGSDCMPLKVTKDDYVMCEEKIGNTLMSEGISNWPVGPLWWTTGATSDKTVANIQIRAYERNDIISFPSMESMCYLPVDEMGVIRTYIQPTDAINPIIINVLDYIDTATGSNQHIFNETPKFQLMKNGESLYLVDGTYSFVPTLATSEPFEYEPDYPPHPKFSFTASQKTDNFFNNCPINAMISKGRFNENINAKLISISNVPCGRYGELMYSDKFYSILSVKYNDENIYNGAFNAWSFGSREDGVYELTLTNSNVVVDDIPGKNVTTVYFDQNQEDWNFPVMKMLQFRDNENNVTDRFINPNEGTIMFAGGDFEPRSTPYIDENGYERAWEYEECQPMAVEVSYAPYGTDDWQPLEGIEHQSEFDDIPGMGFFYIGSLASVNVPSENKWYDLKFCLVDESGNWQEQVVSPAFKIESLTPDAITEVINGDATEVARYSVDGRHITSPEQGINIVVMSDGTTRKVLVK